LEVKSKPKIFRTLAAVGCLTAVVVLAILIIPSGPSKKNDSWIQAAVDRYSAAPSQAQADEFARMLDQQELTEEQAEKILEVLLTPKVVTRRAYPAGQVCCFSLQRNNRVSFNHVRISTEEQIWSKGQRQSSGASRGGNYLDTRPRFLNLHPIPKEPGTYHMEVRYKYSLALYSKARREWRWRPSLRGLPRSLFPHKTNRMIKLSSPIEPGYKCEFAVPVEITVVDPNDAETIEVVTDPELDRKMSAAFTPRQAQMGGSYGHPKRHYDGGLEIKFTDLPVAAAFKYSYLTEDGVLLKTPPLDYPDEPVKLRVGSSGLFCITARQLDIDQAGQHSGTVILESDPNSAYKDPAIKTIWGGRLEFPFSFTVRSDE
jgi:hypothetical protein